MSDLTALTDLMTVQATTHTRELAALNRAESIRSAAFAQELARLQADRAVPNALREQMNGIMADVLKVLKQTGEQIRQSS